MIDTHTRQAIRQVLLITLLLNLAVAGGKIALGLLTGALAILADGLHSLTDSAGNIAGLIANHYAAQPPDAQHPYGHRRFETLAALLIGGLLLLTAWEIGRGALERLQAAHAPEVVVAPLTLGVLLATLIINVCVSRYQMRRGQQLRSEVLLADAKNTRADVFVTLSVMTGMLLVALTGWWWLDVLVALPVMLLIGRAALQILWQSGGVLVDAAPYPPEQLVRLLEDVPGVLAIARARSRGTLDAAHVDIDVLVMPSMPVGEAEAIAGTIRGRLARLPGSIAEIEVHFAVPPRPFTPAPLMIGD
ncbi:MAG: cation diffusion facilitator family transporter [Anaerolineae bacterium]|jgi:cation diffusion facilitator family transporter|nr:cation diffusion facilitator family transporter [Anaerolineae bacterium]